LRVSAIIPSAGAGTRMNAGISKQFLPLGGKPVLCHALSVFDLHPAVTEIVLVVSNDDRAKAEELVFRKHTFRKVLPLVQGGAKRSESVYQGLKALSSETDYVLVHDGCRPFVTPEMISQTLESALKFGGAVVAVPLRDTLKRAEEQLITETIPRAGLWRAQTPQAFRFSILLKAYEEAMKSGADATDDALLVERLGAEVAIVCGSDLNIKITVPEDMFLAELILMRGKDRKTGEGRFV
jgi:2-C-methyl-D-erythritol 4-phosphate cytidylyltransferase